MTGLAYIRGIDMCRTFTAGTYTIMTGDTGIGRRRMIKGRHKPVGGAMTGITGLHCYHVSRTHALCNHAIVTTRAGTDDLRVINQRINRSPQQCTMTGLAFVRTIYMCR